MDYSKRIAPAWILPKTSKSNEVFTFGSNQAGNHKKYAAKTALGFGAKYGQAEGLQGRSYGIPTKGKSMDKVLPIREIKPYVDRFIQFAISRPDLTFLVTEIGCGASGYRPKDIAPLFENAVTCRTSTFQKDSGRS